MGHKSPSSHRWKLAQDALEILITRKMVRASRLEGTGSTWPDFMPRVGDYESAGQRHWRLMHKNLNPRRSFNRTGRVRVIKGAA